MASLRSEAWKHANTLWSDQRAWSSSGFRREIRKAVDKMSRPELHRLMDFTSIDDWHDAARDTEGVYEDPRANPFHYH